MAAMKAALVGIRVASASSEMVTDVMEAIVKRVLLAESEIDNNYELQKMNRKTASFGRLLKLLTSVHVGLQMSRELILVSMGF
ncbi:hypothetical protein ACFX11_009172 [Malus domestica]